MIFVRRVRRRDLYCIVAAHYRRERRNGETTKWMVRMRAGQDAALSFQSITREPGEGQVSAKPSSAAFATRSAASLRPQDEAMHLCHAPNLGGDSEPNECGAH